MSTRKGHKHENACRGLLRQLQRGNGSEPDRIQALERARKALDLLVRDPHLGQAKRLRLLREVVEGLALGCLKHDSVI